MAKKKKLLGSPIDRAGMFSADGREFSFSGDPDMEGISPEAFEETRKAFQPEKAMLKEKLIIYGTAENMNGSAAEFRKLWKDSKDT